MRLSDAGLHQRQTKALYFNHRPAPWPTEDASRDGSNRLLAVTAGLKTPARTRHLHKVTRFERCSYIP